MSKYIINYAGANNVAVFFNDVITSKKIYARLTQQSGVYLLIFYLFMEIVLIGTGRTLGNIFLQHFNFIA